MKIQPEIKFHECSRTPWVENYINERLDKLDRLAGGEITSASATISGDQHSHRKGNLYSVKAEIHVPPNHILVANKGREVRDMQMELRPLIKQAFEALEAQLSETMEKRRNDVKAHSKRDGGPPLSDATAAPEEELPEEEPPE